MTEISCSVAIPDYPTYYVTSVDIIDSVVTPLSDDPNYVMLPETLTLWASDAFYHSTFEGGSWTTVSPGAGPVDPYSGDFVNLFTEVDTRVSDVTWDSATYSSVGGYNYGEGFLKPAYPVITYDVDPYIPIVDLQIPPIDLPSIIVPYIALPDFTYRYGGHQSGSGSGGQTLTAKWPLVIEGDHIYLDAPNAGWWALFALNGSIYWHTVQICDVTQESNGPLLTGGSPQDGENTPQSE